MSTQITALILTDETISINGNELVGNSEVADALSLALQNDPNFILVIEPAKNEFYKGIGTVIYASQRVGMPAENLRFMTEGREVVTFDELQARNTRSSE